MLGCLKFASHGFQTVSLAQKKRHQCQHGKPGEKQNLVHGRVKPRARTTHDDRLRMLGPPPADRTKDERNIEKREYAEERAQQCATVRLLNQSTQQKIGNVEQPQHECRRQPRVPRPPDSPHRVSPDGPGNKNHGCKSKPNFAARNTKPIPARLTPPDIKQVRHKADKECRESGPGACDVEKQDAVNQALLRVGWSDEKRRICRSSQKHKNTNGRRDILPHQAHSSRRYSPKSHSAVKKTRSNTARKPTPFHCTKGARSKRPFVTSMLAASTGVRSGSISNGNNSSRMRACAEIAESAVPTIEMPRLPRKSTMIIQ